MILEKITRDELFRIGYFNVDTVFKVPWISFMQMDELTYTTAELKIDIFTDAKFTWFNISFAKSNQYAILLLKQSKTDTDHIRVWFILAATGKPLCLISTLKRLFVQEFWSTNSLLFRRLSSAFFWQNVVSILIKQIGKERLFIKDYSDYCFRKSKAEHTGDHEIFNRSIQ